MNADVNVLRRAAARLRDPYLGNWRIDVALALADALDAVAQAMRFGPDMASRLGYSELIAVARAVLGETESQALADYQQRARDAVANASTTL